MLRCSRLFFAMIAMLVPAASFANAVTALPYHRGQEIVVRCPLYYFCSIALDRGEQIHQGVFSDQDSLQPRSTTTGSNIPRPYILIDPKRTGDHYNVVLSTDRRMYYFRIIVTAGDAPAYYAMTFPDDLGAFHAAQRTADNATRAAADALPNPRNCFDARYAVDRLPVFFVPEHVCNEGRHTFIMLHQFRETPGDLPALFTVIDGHRSLANYTFDAAHYRYVVDGVPDTMVLVAGTPKNQRTVRVLHLPLPTPAPEKKR